MSDAWHDAPKETFDFSGGSIEVAYLPALWRVAMGDTTSENRRLDDALTNILGPATSSSLARARIAIDVMQWRGAQGG
jgi:hypothetical protein